MSNKYDKILDEYRENDATNTVTSLNSLTGAVTLAQGTGIALTVVDNTITITATGASGAISATSVTVTGTAGNGFVKLLNQSTSPTAVAGSGILHTDSGGNMAWISDSAVSNFMMSFNASLLTADRIYKLPNAAGTIALTTTSVTSLGAIGSSANLNGMTFSNGVLNLEPASASFGGVVTTGSQTFAGGKTWSGGQVFTAGASSLLIQNNSITTTPVSAFNTYVQNPATSGTPIKISPRHDMRAAAWNGSANEYHYFGWELFTSGNGSTPTLGRLRYMASTTNDAGTEKCSISDLGRIYMGGATPTFNAYYNIAAGSTTVAPIQWTSGPLNTGGNILAGNDQFLTDKRYFTITTGTQVVEYAFFDTAGTAGRVPFETTNGRLTDVSGFTFASNTLTVPLFSATGISNLTGGMINGVPLSVSGNSSPAIFNFYIGVQTSATPATAWTITLPAGTDGEEHIIKDETGNAYLNPITIACSGGQLIDGVANYYLNTSYQVLRLYFRNSGWWIIG